MTLKGFTYQSINDDASSDSELLQALGDANLQSFIDEIKGYKWPVSKEKE